MDGSESESGVVSLPVLQSGPSRSNGKRPIAKSKMGPRRAIVLLVVHLLIVAHVIQWLIAGMTLSPLEPSESMKTLEFGAINAGFVMFVVAIASTLLAGRFFCGWACHVIALQDACTWMLNKAGIRPKAFRSRLLMLAPLLLGLYMFVWPNFKRFVVKPALEALDLPWPIWLRDVPELTGFRTEFMVEDFWATFPPWYIAIPFLLVCGLGTVYVLGNKGFCTYGCPYGGFFAPADKVAPVRIRVTDDCEHCGHCTSVCGSNVRVHEEVHAYGMVVDPGCMKCMDCVSVCPNDALYVGLGKPALLAPLRDRDAAERRRAKRASRWDFSWRGEIVAALAMALYFFAFRGMMNAVPMLMAAGLAAIATALTWLLVRLLLEPNVRLHTHQLKLKGRVRGAGMLASALTIGIVLVAGWSTAVKWNLLSGRLAHDGLATPVAILMHPGYEPPPGDAARAKRSVSRLTSGGPVSMGGFGWSHASEDVRRLAYAELVLGDKQAALKELEALLEQGRPLDALVSQYMLLMRNLAVPYEELVERVEPLLLEHEHLMAPRVEFARTVMGMTGDLPSAMRVWQPLLERDDPPGDALLEAARLHAAAESWEEVNRLATLVMTDEEEDPVLRLRAAVMLASILRQDAIEWINGLELSEFESGEQIATAAALFAEAGQPELALGAARLAAERDDLHAPIFPRLAGLVANMNAPELAERFMERAEDADLGPLDRTRLAWFWLRTGDRDRALGLWDGVVAEMEDLAWWDLSAGAMDWYQFIQSATGPESDQTAAYVAWLIQRADEEDSGILYFAAGTVTEQAGAYEDAARMYDSSRKRTAEWEQPGQAYDRVLRLIPVKSDPS